MCTGRPYSVNLIVYIALNAHENCGNMSVWLLYVMAGHNLYDVFSNPYLPMVKKNNMIQ